MGNVTILPRTRLAWHRQMAEDRELSHVAFRVAVVIGAHFNNATGKTFVGYDTIGETIGVCRRTVFAAVKELVRRGHLEVEPGGGRKVANSYRMNLKTVQQSAPFRGAETVQNPAQNGATGCTPTLKNTSYSNSARVRARGNHPSTCADGTAQRGSR